MRVDRSKLISVLEAVEPGRSARDILEQSSCYCFVNGTVMTFNGEIACRMKSPLDITGAVQAAPFLTALKKLTEDAVKVDVADGMVNVVGLRDAGGKEVAARRGFDVRMEAEVKLPVESVERPLKDDWRKLHRDFTEAVKVVHECAGKDQSEKAFTGVHIHSDYVEATDRFQIARYTLATGFRKSTLISKEAAKDIADLDMTKVAETKGWVHFRNPSGLILSCVRFAERFPVLDEFVAKRGKRIVLPKGLAKEVERCEDFSKEEADDNTVIVSLKPGWMMIRGVGVSGRAWAEKKVKYHGPPMKFRIGPAMLIQITSRNLSAEVGPEALRVTGEGWVYVASVATADEKKKSPDPEPEEDND